MAVSQAQKKAAAKYKKEKYDRLNIAYPKEYIATIKAHAAQKGVSIAGYVKAAIDDRMDKDDTQDSLEKIIE